MRILVDLNHPAHVHLFRNAIREWRRQGVEVLITPREKDLTTRLLNLYGLEYQYTSNQKHGALGFVTGALELDRAVWRAARAFDPDWMMGTSFAIAHVSRLVRGRSIVFAEDDYQSSKLFWQVSRPFADYIVTPDTIPDDFGRKHVRYRGLQELAYLHPNRFTPDPAALQDFGLQPGEPYSVLRFVSFQASHDVGQRGISLEAKRELVRRLSDHGRVLITAEGELPPEFAAYATQAAPHQIHHLLAFADLFVGDSQSMTLEAAVLGTPALRLNTFVGRTPVIEHLEAEYGLTYGFRVEQENAMLEKVKSLLADPHLKATWRAKQANYLAGQLDLTAWIVELPHTIEKLAARPAREN